VKRIVSEIDRFIDKKCFDALYSALSSYIEDNPDNLELESTSNFVEEPDGACLIDMEIIKTENCVIEEDEITFDTIISCEIEIEETIKRNRETDSVNQWFRMQCKAVLADTLKSFSISNIEVYSK
jgi:hypothetical protein